MLDMVTLKKSWQTSRLPDALKASEKSMYARYGGVLFVEIELAGKPFECFVVGAPFPHKPVYICKSALAHKLHPEVARSCMLVKKRGLVSFRISEDVSAV